MSPTLLKTSWRYLAKHPWQLLLAILGVALGVAVVVAIDLANESARRAFTLSAETVAGRATHQVVGGPAGLDESVYRQLRVDLGLRAAAPLVEGYALAPTQPGLTLHILGVDPLAEQPFRPFLAASNQASRSSNGGPGLAAIFTRPGAVLLSTTVAQSLGLKPGDTLPLQFGSDVQQAVLIGTLEPADDATRRALDGLVITDIATAQEWLGMLGKLSQVDLILDDADVARVTAALPAGVRLVTPDVQTQALTQLTAAFETNLTALSLLALIVGTFLIYNTMTFSVVQRRGLLGTLRCLGVTRGEVFALVLGEALLIGLIGSLLGLALGVLLGRGLVGLVTRTINDLYFAVSVREMAIAPLPLLKGLGLGLLATLAAAGLPAWEATTTPPRTVMRRSSFEERARKAIPITTAAGVLMLAVGLGLLFLPRNNLLLSFGALFFVTFGAAALAPLATLVVMRAARPVLGRLFGLLGGMAARDVVAALSRTSVAIAALMIAVAVTIGVGLMVGSFRATVIDWLNATLIADVYVSPPSRATNVIETTIPPAAVERLAAVDGVASVRRYRTVDVDGPDGTTLVIATQLVPERDGRAYRFLGGDPAEIFRRFAAGEVLISEPLAYHRGLKTGDQLTFSTDHGERSFRIAGVFYDYGADRGVAMLDLALYHSLWNDQALTSLAIYATPGADVDALVERMRTAVGQMQVSDASGVVTQHAPALLIRSNQALRNASLVIFDRTFAITNVLQLLATIVAFVGILAALMALQLERARELAVLRANGLTPGQLWALVLSQTGLMGLTAGLLALPVGVMIAAVLVFVINRRSFGWSLQFQLDWTLFAQAVALAVIAALLAGLYPAWRMARTAPALALREE